MNMNHQLSLVLQNDKNIQKLGCISAVHNPKDSNHLERRQQQRAISLSMMKVAIIYGNRQFSYGAVTYTLTDKNLRITPYKRFIDVLRGLRVVCVQGFPEPKIMTAYWHNKTKRKVHR
ncbi:MAG: hypothetical protein F6K54_35310 [Okeania sp. SIO3B5]|uniref:hypothetical protein n=1 Tax=Okeania sp. SIO3B5 TaxID=2607811 RepID=UPI0013FF64B2|nr:hypothetical protein [Okeania sp. SIO3B5]NEO57862.1 hypothetical protein [Okeania sp. SIO3B5]